MSRMNNDGLEIAEYLEEPGAEEGEILGSNVTIASGDDGGIWARFRLACEHHGEYKSEALFISSEVARDILEKFTWALGMVDAASVAKDEAKGSPGPADFDSSPGS